MPSQRQVAQARRVAERVARGLAEDVRRLREDAGLTRAALAAEAGLDRSFLGRIEDGAIRPSLETYARIAGALGADLGAHLYPNTGPAVRDRHQARIAEALLVQLSGRWRAYLEVAVRRPSRGWIDVVLHDAAAATVVAAEIQSSLSRLEQLLRWSAEKAASLPSWEVYAQLGDVRAASTLLIIRSTRATREVAKQFARQLDTSYPAHPADALAALRGERLWPGPALVWARDGTDGVRFSERRATERVGV